MHHLSFVSHDPIFEFQGLRLSAQIFTFQNVYAPDASQLNIKSVEDGFSWTSDSLTWANGQEKAEGNFFLDATCREGRSYLHARAVHVSEEIRCLKLTIRDVPTGSIANLRQPALEEQDCPIPPEGMILKYPEGFTGLYTPLLVVRHAEDRFTSFRSQDEQVRPKVFALLPHGTSMDVELIFEASARSFGHSIDVPVWEIASWCSYQHILEEQRLFVEKAYELMPWETRPDVPAWARSIALVASIHCCHWTGYVFNTYDDVLRNLQEIARYVPPFRVLAYLPGWEGRYYYQYGEFAPDPRLGGAKGFRRLMEATKDMGMHVMPMFMINGANPHHEGFKTWGKDSLYHSPSGFPQYWGSCDWDTSRHYDHNCGVALNPGAPQWQDHLVGQVRSLISEYGFDAVFMDLAAVFCNDLRYDTHQAVIDIARRIREDHPQVLVAGEGWYDAISAPMPLTQPSLTPKGDCRWSDRPYAPLFDTYCRCFGHLGTGDPSRASTGVFEFGWNNLTQGTPLRKGIIPTITIVDGTLKSGPEKSYAIFRQANDYARLFLKPTIDLL